MLPDLSGFQEKPAGQPPGHSLFLFLSIAMNSWVLTYVICFICWVIYCLDVVNHPGFAALASIARLQPGSCVPLMRPCQFWSALLFPGTS